ncbi:MAG: tRNA 4-thiouridine(8) synthase ThiI [Bacilli bacterium]|nr:tRNA 4-thiouridine(8) synthase ThiI [Bacilli bacterium]
MKYTSIMVRFGELSTKGKNKKDFVNMLARNIKHALKSFISLTYDVLYDHIYVNLHDEDYEPILNILKDISGIQALSLVIKIESDIELIKKTALMLMKESEGKTFKVTCKRSNKRFPLISDEIIRQVAPVILKNTTFKVDVHKPDIKLAIEVRDEGTYLSTKTVLASGGYPIGVAGKAVMMLSGGIDSPVATYLLMKRGVIVECIHFASPPYTSEAVIDKLTDILHELNRYQYKIRLHIVPFTKIQTKIYEVADESYAITIMRRMMYRLANALADKLNCLAIANGESIGQVASQTLDSMGVIEKVASLPIIRPLAVMDKLDIIKIAKQINTYDISIRPYEDCCTIFAPKNPKTKPRLHEVLFYEEKFDFASLIKEALDKIKVITIN